ncbi:Protein trichome birefringence-like 25 [Raphanus sativus]|nr:Protein trichome birefringence-like 25 [Raphanus sativus]
MKIEGNPFGNSSHQRNQIFLNFVAFFLLVGLTYRFIITDSTGSLIAQVRTSPAEPSGLTASVAQAPAPVYSPVNITAASQNVSTKCDIFTRNWVPDPSGPVYTNISCRRHIQEHQNCLKNGRPDSNYLLWRWKPRDCDLPRLDPDHFFHRMRNKWWAFIGDSISRNHVQSFLCILSQEFRKTQEEKEDGSKASIALLGTTSMSLLRPDGHPGPYRYPNPFSGMKIRDPVHVQNDCLHWCLPGPIDSWNDLMVEVMLNREIDNKS